MTRARELANFADDVSGLETLTVSDVTDLSVSASNINSATNQITDSSTDLNVDSNTLVVDKSANAVGVGTATPATATGFNSPCFEVAGSEPSIVLSKTGVDSIAIVNHSSTLKFINDTDDRAFFQLHQDAPANSLVLNSTGNVGIGTTSPQNPAHIHDSTGSNSSSGSSYAQFTNLVTGATGSDGAVVGINGGSDPILNIWQNENASVRIATNNTARLTVDSSGLVGIGCSPSHHLHIEPSGYTGSYCSLRLKHPDSTASRYTTLDVRADDNNGLQLGVGSSGTSTSNFYRQSYIESYSRDLNLSTYTGGYNITFRTAPSGGSATERLRIDSSGDIGIGGQTANIGSNSNTGLSFGNSGYLTQSRDNSTLQYLNRNTSDGKLLIFYKNGSEVGSISTDTNSVPSDRNFKRDIEDINLGLNLINKLNPKQFLYKISDDDSPKMYGLIAQEMEESLTECGIEKNSITLLQHRPKEKETESDYDVDYSKLIPVLINAVNELSAKVTALESA